MNVILDFVYTILGYVAWFIGAWLVIISLILLAQFIEDRL